VLGHRTAVGRVQSALAAIQDLQPKYVLVGVEDYKRFPAPWHIRLTNPWHSSYLARMKAATAVQEPFDMLFVNTWELMVAFQHLARKVPAIAYLDAVPATIHSQLVDRGLGGWKRNLAYHLHNFPFRKAVHNFRMFMPMGSDCRDSLVNEYGIDARCCSPVTLAPQNPAAPLPPRDCSGHLRLLFVGNDFFRKGGRFLLDLYTAHLSGYCTLTVVSNDSALASATLPPGVELLRNLNVEQMQEVYRQHHIFLFPTQQDFMPQVLGEALLFGVPCLANNVGGIRDLIHNGQTGFLMERDATQQMWAARIQELASNPALLVRLSASARRFAEEHLLIDRFNRLVADVIEQLRA